MDAKDAKRHSILALLEVFLTCTNLHCLACCLKSAMGKIYLNSNVLESKNYCTTKIACVGFTSYSWHKILNAMRTKIQKQQSNTQLSTKIFHLGIGL